MILVDPDKNLVLVYNFEHGTSEPYTLQDSVKAGIYEDLWIDFSGYENEWILLKIFLRNVIIGHEKHRKN